MVQAGLSTANWQRKERQSKAGEAETGGVRQRFVVLCGGRRREVRLWRIGLGVSQKVGDVSAGRTELVSWTN